MRLRFEQYAFLLQILAFFFLIISLQYMQKHITAVGSNCCDIKSDILFMYDVIT